MSVYGPRINNLSSKGWSCSLEFKYQNITVIPMCTRNWAGDAFNGDTQND